MTLGNLTGVMVLTWEFGANGYKAMNLMGAWFKRRCTARGATLLGVAGIFNVENPAILDIAGR